MPSPEGKNQGKCLVGCEYEKEELVHGSLKLENLKLDSSQVVYNHYPGWEYELCGLR